MSNSFWLFYSKRHATAFLATLLAGVILSALGCGGVLIDNDGQVELGPNIESSRPDDSASTALVMNAPGDVAAASNGDADRLEMPVSSVAPETVPSDTSTPEPTPTVVRVAPTVEPTPTVPPATSTPEPTAAVPLATATPESTPTQVPATPVRTASQPTSADATSELVTYVDEQDAWQIDVPAGTTWDIDRDDSFFETVAGFQHEGAGMNGELLVILSGTDLIGTLVECKELIIRGAGSSGKDFQEFQLPVGELTMQLLVAPRLIYGCAISGTTVYIIGLEYSREAPERFSRQALSILRSFRPPETPARPGGPAALPTTSGTRPLTVSYKDLRDGWQIAVPDGTTFDSDWSGKVPRTEFTHESTGIDGEIFVLRIDVGNSITLDECGEVLLEAYEANDPIAVAQIDHQIGGLPARLLVAPERVGACLISEGAVYFVDVKVSSDPPDGGIGLATSILLSFRSPSSSPRDSRHFDRQSSELI